MLKITNLVFCKFSDANDDKIVFATLKWLFVKRKITSTKVINVRS